MKREEREREKERIREKNELDRKALGCFSFFLCFFLSFFLKERQQGVQGKKRDFVPW